MLAGRWSRAVAIHWNDALVPAPSAPAAQPPGPRRLWSIVRRSPSAAILWGRNVLSVTGFSRPSGDVATSGWTAVPSGAAYAALAEVSPSDAEYVESVSLAVAPLILSLNPSLSAGIHTRRVRARRTGAVGQIKVSLLDSSNVEQGTSGWIALTGTFATYEVNITTTGAATRAKIEVQP